MNPKTDPDLLVSVQLSLVELWVGGGTAGLGAISVTVRPWDLLKEVTIIFITPHHNLASGQVTRREHSPSLQQKIRLKIY